MCAAIKTGQQETTTEGSVPDWDALRATHDDWRREDRYQHGPIASPLERYSRWVESVRPAGHHVPPHGYRAPRVPAGRRDELARAVVYFAAAFRPLPDDAQWGRLVAAIDSRLRPNPYDVALAWANGWRGDHLLGPIAIPTLSEHAVLALVEQVLASVTASVRLLVERTGIAIVGKDEHASMAAAMAMSLLGTCDCGHHLRNCHGCGRMCCFPDHDLRAWDPATCHLRPFLDQAVRGTAQRRIMGGAFAVGMLFRTLEREGRLLCRTVEWGCCEVCGRMFEGGRCPEPHDVALRSVRREPRKNQLIVPFVGESGHVPTQRWWCAPCRHLYGSARRGDTVEPCPRCGRRATASKAVWTLPSGPARSVDVTSVAR